MQWLNGSNAAEEMRRGGGGGGRVVGWLYLLVYCDLSFPVA